MAKTLGLDLGTNSLGWAILDDITGDILDKGVVVFPEGIDAANDTLETPAAVRRAARMGRRMKFRRKMRKWMLLKALIDNGMCPMTLQELAAWRKTGAYPVGNKQFIDWLKSTDAANPYADRAAAANGKVSPLVLGRALYHIAQRRGFKSSRKDAQEDEETTDKTLGAVKGDIAKLTKEIADAGCRTLGQYFAKHIEAEQGKIAKTPVRKRYTGRVEHYMTEFAVIMEAQGISPDDEFCKKCYDAIFYQRPLRSQKHLVGNCPLEKNAPRAQIGHPLFEEFRMRAFVNNLSFENERIGESVPLTNDERELACSAFEKDSPTMKFGAISKLFKKKMKAESLKFHYYHDDETISTCSTRHKIKRAFGAVVYDEQMVFDALTFFDDNEKLAAWFKKHYPGLTDDGVAALCKIRPKEGNAQYSLRAIRKILRFLRKGYELSQARFMAKLPDVISEFAMHEEEILRNLQERLWAYREERRHYGELDAKARKLVTSPMPLFDRYKEYLQGCWGVDETRWEKLYLKGDETYAPVILKRSDGKTLKRLPAVRLGMIRNPLVQRSMTTLRRLVNYLGEHGKIAPDDTIRIELARSVNDFATRKAWQAWQNSRRKLREEAADEIKKFGVPVTEDAIERYVLWKEQNKICFYTKKVISLVELFFGNAFDVEHTIPRSLSGDDSLANKTICDAVYNRQTKMGRIPRDCPNWDEIDILLSPWKKKVEGLEKDYRNQMRSARSKTDPVQRSQARIKALTTKLELNYWRDKMRRFEIASDKLTDPVDGLSGFKRRQLVDTGIMCSHAVELLRSVYPKVYSVNGAATSFARKAWGIQGDEAKDRSEHTHHAKDAMVIAALTPGRFNAICAALKDDGRMPDVRPCDICKPPYAGFAEKVRKATDEILVKHILCQTTLRPSSKRNALAKAHPQKDNPSKIVKFVKSRGDTVRGALHKETFYGCIQNPEGGGKTFVVRKPLEGSIAAVEAIADKIVDGAVREVVKSALARLKDGGEKSIQAGMIKMPSGVPIKKVRIVAHTTNPMTLRNHAMPSEKDYKNPYYVTASEGSNFRLGVFEKGGRLSVVPDNVLDWAQNHKKDDYVPLDKQEGFVGYIVPGTMAIIKASIDEDIEKLPHSELRKRLYTTVSVGGEGDNRAQFRYALAAGMKKDLGSPLSNYSYENPPALLRLGPKKFLANMLFDGIHFKMMLDGTIVFRK